ncbi:MAG: right-handed parallel beta-helix repeat-containing protein [Phycisphaerales bacterium]|nr:right-handed parallel beta-helix repeat-containing protein [Phycisphaerales bacterium]
MLKITVLLWAATTATVTDLPTITLRADDTRIDQSCRIEIPAGVVLQDANGDGVLHIVASDIVIEFAPGAHLRGAAHDADPDAYEGFGIRIVDQRNVTIRGARLSGFRAAIWATAAPGLVLEDIDASDSRRARLFSERLMEAGQDWLRPHDNDDNTWLTRYASALYIEDSDEVIVRRCRVWHSQNALCLDRVNGARIYDNDFSFNSGWGLALWRSNRNVISRNAIDFCVRGYSHGVYNRGQDSAGILAFEQNSDNIIAENSVTHGGDGYFGFAGREAMGQVDPPSTDFDYKRRGNNDNLLIANDFSYAPAHGIELTFSFGNRFLNNRIVENAICGVWGGYSQDTLIAGNTFERNGDMGYGLERGGVNIEFGRGNRIIGNVFRDNYCGVHLWWVRRGRPMSGPWITANLTGSDGNLIAGNTFERDRLVFDLRGDGEVTLGANKLVEIGERLQATPETRVREDAEAAPPSFEVPDYPVFGTTRPVGARPELRGRQNIIMTAWGPWDHVSPLVRLAEDRGRAHLYVLHNIPADARVTVSPENLKVTRESGLSADGIAPAGTMVRVESATDGVFPYTLRVAAGDLRIEQRATLLATTWQVEVLASAADSETDANWRDVAEGFTVHRSAVSPLEFVRVLPSVTDNPDLNLRQRRAAHRYALVAQTRLTLEPGAWRFEAVSDEPVRIRVDGELVVNSWERHWGPRRSTGVLQVTEQRRVEVVVEHFQRERLAILSIGVVPEEQSVAKGQE